MKIATKKAIATIKIEPSKHTKNQSWRLKVEQLMPKFCKFQIAVQSIEKYLIRCIYRKFHLFLSNRVLCVDKKKIPF